MRLNKLAIADKGIFNKFLSIQKHELCVYAFEDTYIWRGLYDIRWTLIDGSLCVFFIDKMGCFLYLPPLARQISQDSLQKTFAVMDGFNNNREISRIENIEEKDAPTYRDLGWVCKIKSYDYLCVRNELARLQGKKFKSKRSCCNYFTKHYAFEYLPFALKYKKDCLELYDCWANQRSSRIRSHLYQGMLSDSKICLKKTLEGYPDLNFMARIVRIDKKVRAFTLGYPLNKETFCILYEITDLTVKGLAQFIFRAFCNELEDYRYINIMDDSGLDNLKKVKLSYKPLRRLPSFTITRPRPAIKYKNAPGAQRGIDWKGRVG